MKNFKKIIIALLVISMVFAFCSCGKEPEKEDETNVARLAALKGPTAMGLIKLIDDGEEGNVTDFVLESTLAGSADEITPLLLKGDLDFASIPANLAAVLYKNSEGQVQIVAVNTLGVLYIVENGNSLNSFADLKGKTIYATGKGSTPEYTLRYLLSANGIDPDNDVTIEFKSEPAEIVALMTGGQEVIAMLPQPYVTVAKSKVENFTVRFNLTEEWDKLGTGSKLITSVIVARKDYLEKNPKTSKLVIDSCKASIEYVLANNDDAAALVGKYNIVAEKVAKAALPQCNITFISGDDMKTALEGYFEVLYNQNPKSVGGAVPEDDIYYMYESK